VAGDDQDDMGDGKGNKEVINEEESEDADAVSEEEEVEDKPISNHYNRHRESNSRF